MSILKKLAGETAIYGLSSILSRLLNFVILTPYLTRVFLPGEYGIVSEMYAYVAFLMVLFTFRMETAFFRFGSKENNLERSFRTSALFLILTTFLFSAILILLAQPIADWLQYPDHSEYIIWFVFIIAFDTLAAIPMARLRLENRPILFAVIKTASILVNMAFIFLFLEGLPWLIDQGIEGLAPYYFSDNRILYVFIANFIGSLTPLILLLPQYRKLQFKPDFELWKKMILYALPLMVVGFAAITNQLLNIPLMKAYLPGDLEQNLEQVGIYTGCYKIAILMSLFIQAFNYAAEPFFFRNADRKDSKDIYAMVGQAFAMVGSIGFLGILLYLDLVKHLISSNYWAGLGIVPILLLAFFFLGLYYNFSIWFKLKDKTIYGAFISIGGAIITITLNLWLLPIIGFYGAAWAALACYGFMAMASYLTGRYYYPIAYPIVNMLAYILLALAFYWLSTFIRTFIEDQTILLLLCNTLLFLFFITLLYLFEKESLAKMNKPSSE